MQDGGGERVRSNGKRERRVGWKCNARLLDVCWGGGALTPLGAVLWYHAYVST